MKKVKNQNKAPNKVISLTLLILFCIAPLKGEAIIYKKHQQEILNPHVVFLISEDPHNHEAHKTIPPFAEMLKSKFGFNITVLLGEGKHGSYKFDDIDVVSKADLLVVFCRRIALPHDQLQMIKNYLKAGKPLVGIRTANHGFSVRDEVEDGYEGWWGFVPDILGCEYKGHEPVKSGGTYVKVVPESVDHPILQNINLANWYSNGQVHFVNPLLDQKAIVLLTGQAKNKPQLQPVAWTRQTAYKSRIFYTSLGYPDDFEYEPFRKLLTNGILWALELDPQ
jgi:type 1 glutamine amidotransferase